MIPVDQTVLTGEPVAVYGASLRAAVASFLELDVERVPDFSKEGSVPKAHAAFVNFVENDWGYIMRHQVDLADVGKDECHMIYGLSPREEGVPHVVIGKGGRIEHDPHPSRAGLVDKNRAGWMYVTFRDRYCENCG